MKKMAKCLRLNRETLVAEYVAHMGRCIDRLLDEYYREVAGALRSEAARGDVQVERLDSADKAHLVRRLVAGPLAVIGTIRSPRRTVSNSGLNGESGTRT